MSWITIVWSMNAAACLTLAGIYLLVWCKQREGWVYLVFSCSAVAAAALTAFELLLLRAQTTEQYGAILRWVQLPVWVLVVSLVVFVRLYLRAGRPWLAWSVCGVRTLALILNFIFIPNLSYREITSLKQVSWWGGETVSVPVGVTNPWILVAQLSLLLFVIFFMDATITAWRRGDRQHALVVGGALTFFSAIGVGEVVLVVWGIIQVPFFACFSYLGLITAMGYQIGSDMLRAAQVAWQLQASEAELRESMERMDLAASAAGLGLWMWDIARNQVWINDKGRSLFGFAPSEKLDAERFRSRIHPDDREAVRVVAENALSRGVEYDTEYRIAPPGGQTRWVHSRGRVELNADGEPLRVRGVSMDITERRRAEEKFRVAVEASPIGIVLVDGQGRIVLVNTYTEKLFGYAREEIIDQPVEILLPERFRGAHPGHRAEFLAAPTARAMGAGRELFARRKDGTEFPVEIGLSPMETGEGLLVLGAIVDISARKRAELEVERHRAELTHLSRVALMGEISASLAHEMNQPLTAMVSNATAGQRFIDSGHVVLSELRELLSDISADGRRASDVVHGIRRMVKKSETVRQRINLNDLVRDVVQIVHSDSLLRSCEVKTSLESDLPTIEADPVQLRQVLLNLVINGFDAMHDTPMGDRITEVTAARQGDAIRVSVRDYGGGIAEETRQRLFEPFFTTKAEGLGMGLAIVRSIVESHGGKIGAENVEGGGARFHFTVPINAPVSV